MLTESYRLRDTADQRVVRFSNGLTAILARHDAAPTAAVRIYVRGGSVFEGALTGTGLSHLFEHLITCDGAGKYSESDLLELADDLGGLVNAYTTMDHICYHANVAAAQAGDALEMLGQYVVAPHLSRAVFDRELGVVQRELERDRDDPETQLEELVQGLLYEGHPHAAPVIGYRERLVTLTHEDLLRRHGAVHAGENLVVVIAGEIDIDAVSERISTLFAQTPRGVRVDVPLEDPMPLVAIRRVTRAMEVESASITMAFPTVRERHVDDVPLDLLSSIMLDGDDARLVKRLRWDEQLVYDIGGTHDSAPYAPGSFQVSAQCDADKLECAEAAVLEELAALETRIVSSRELERAKRQALSTILYHRETAEGYATQLGEDYLAAGDIAYCEAYLERVRSVTVDEITAAARRYLIGRPFVSGRIVPRDLVAAENRDVATQAPAGVVRAQSDGGLTLLARFLPNSAFVAVSINFIGGVVAENDETSGLFHALGSVWTRGTEEHSADALSAAFAECGAALRSTSGLNQFGLSFVSLVEDFDRLWPLFVEALRSPALSAEEWNKARPPILDAIARLDESWHNELVRFARGQFFATSPYRLDRIGNERSVTAFDALQLRGAYERFVRPANAVLCVAGGVEADSVLERVRRDLANWTGEGERWRSSSKAVATAKGDRLFVKQSSGDREVAGVFIGFPGLSFAGRGERAALTIADTILAGYSLASGRLYQALRSGDNDLAYEVSGIGFAGLLPGYIAYSAGCEPSRVGEVHRVMRDQIDAVCRGAFDADEVARAKAMIRSGELDQLQSAAEIAVRMSVDEVLGLGAEDWRDFLEEVDAATIEQVREAAARYLRHALVAVTTPEPGTVNLSIG